VRVFHEASWFDFGVLLSSVRCHPASLKARTSQRLGVLTEVGCAYYCGPIMVLAIPPVRVARQWRFASISGSYQEDTDLEKLFTVEDANVRNNGSVEDDGIEIG